MSKVLIEREELKRIHRDLDACQKVIWLAGVQPRGSFDPAYVADAQARLKEIDALLAQPVADEHTMAAVANVQGWEKSLSAAWSADPEDTQGAWIVGANCEDEQYPVITVEADQYDAPGDSEKIARALIALWSQAFAARRTQAEQPDEAWNDDDARPEEPAISEANRAREAAVAQVHGLRNELEAIRSQQAELLDAVTPEVIDWVRCGLSVNGRLVDGSHPALDKLRAALSAQGGEA